MSETSAAAALDRSVLSVAIKDEAQRLGFALAGIAPAVAPGGFTHLQEWLKRGYAGEMSYMPRREEAYEHPQHVLRSVRSVVMLAMNYHAGEPNGGREPLPAGRGRISKYACSDGDYHDVLRGRLARLGDFLHARRPGCRTRGVVDTAPLLERDFARLSGLGWFGKNTMLINKRQGSWLFLCALLTDVELEADAPHETAHCGTCTRCLEACPTDAFEGPYVLDARKCISYLTIELRNEPIPLELREGMGEWVFGCDVCQDVCPWNRKAPVSDDRDFQPLPSRVAVDPCELLALDEAAFEARFGKSPLARPGRAGILRNAAIALGNTGDASGVPALCTALQDGEPLVRGAAAWALGRRGGEGARRALQSRLPVEDNAGVREEIERALREGVADHRGPGNVSQCEWKPRGEA